MKIRIEKLVHGGEGIGDVDGMRIFVPYSAPGDVLEIEISEEHRSWGRARIISIVEPAPCRFEPRCPVFGKCGGCQWQHISYETQLEWKREILKESLERIGKVKNPDVLDTLPSPEQWHYRNRIQLHVDSKGRAGFYRPKSKEVVEFEQCFIADERLNRKLNDMRDELKGRDRGIALRLEDGPSFSQINSGQNERLKKTLVDWLTELPHNVVLELYAGAGNFTFEIAKVAERVVASDVDGRAIEFARRCQAEMNVHNVEFVRVPSGRAARRLQGECDAVVLDPPRKGCAEAIPDIVRLEPRSILYVSCDPATLARDVHELAGHGYNLVRSLPVDMFPQTYHVESVTLLQQA